MKRLLSILFMPVLIMLSLKACGQHLQKMSGYGYNMERLSIDSMFFIPNKDTIFTGPYKRAGALVFRTKNGDRTLYAFDGIRWINVSAEIGTGVKDLHFFNDSLIINLHNGDSLVASLPLYTPTSTDGSINITGQGKVFGAPIDITSNEVGTSSNSLTKDSAKYDLKEGTGIIIQGGNNTQFINDISVSAKNMDTIWNAGYIYGVPVDVGNLEEGQVLSYSGGIFTNADPGYSISDISFNGNRPITRDFSQATGVNLGTSTVTGTLEELLYPSQKAQSTLTGTYGSTTATVLKIEKTSDSDIDITLNWSAKRRDYSKEIQSIVVNGQTQTFSQPSPGNSVSGTVTATVPSNTTTTLSNVVTTTDNKVSQSNVSVQFQTKWYYGFVDPGITNPSDGDIIGLHGTLTDHRVQNNGNGSDIVVSNSTNRRFIIVEDASLDPSNLNQIFVGGLNSTGAFTKTTRSFTNASGYSYSVNIYVQNTTTAGDFKFQIQ